MNSVSGKKGTGGRGGVLEDPRYKNTAYRDCRLFKGCYEAALASLTNSHQCGTEKEKENKLPSASSEMHSESGNRTGSKALLKEKENKTNTFYLDSTAVEDLEFLEAGVYKRKCENKINSSVFPSGAGATNPETSKYNALTGC